MTTLTQYTKTDIPGAYLLDPPSQKRDKSFQPQAHRPKSSPKTDSGQKPSGHRSGRNNVNWPVVAWISLLHVGALAAPFFFSWEAVALTFVLHWVTGGIGICLGFHRLLTHGSFQTYRPVKWLLCLVGGLAGEGSVIDWVANHRKHHAHSDQEGDPHSPHDGPWWSHIFWLAHMLQAKAHEEHVKRWSPDLLKDPVVRFIGSMFLPAQFAFGLLLGTIGYAYGGWFMAASFMAWGMFVRLVFVLHSTWFVNSASHMWGYKNYETTDDSRNNWWVALLTYGEGWHNNHHAYPRMAPHGHKWWEIDLTFLTIRALQAVGLAWDVVDYKRR
ncbi:MAG TPA: fatty acid desaturase, partial [Pirellulaceae bacterium]|nr:fatty acid desaturase [Pirellulaceae bacterium]